MDKHLDNIEEQLNTKINTHPNLVMIWKEYLNIKKKNLINEINNCEKMIKKLENVPDQSPEQILLTIHILNMLLSR